MEYKESLVPSTDLSRPMVAQLLVVSNGVDSNRLMCSRYLSHQQSLNLTVYYKYMFGTCIYEKIDICYI